MCAQHRADGWAAKRERERERERERDGVCVCARVRACVRACARGEAIFRVGNFPLPHLNNINASQGRENRVCASVCAAVIVYHLTLVLASKEHIDRASARRWFGGLERRFPEPRLTNREMSMLVF
jgi:hypothetical protein